MTVLATIDTYLETSHQRTESGLMSLASHIAGLEQIIRQGPTHNAAAESALAHYRHAFALVTKTSVGQADYEDLLKAYRGFR